MSNEDMLKWFIPRNKQGGPRTLDLPADEKQGSLSLALVRHCCVFSFSFSVREEDLGLSEVDGGSVSVPTFPRCHAERGGCCLRSGDSPPAGHIAHPYRFCSHTLCPLTSEFWGLWLTTATCCWLQTRARPLIVDFFTFHFAGQHLVYGNI